MDAQIQHERSDIEKNKDALNYLKDFQSFLLSISDPAFKEQRNKVMDEKKRRLKESWIAYHMQSREMDDIIFTDDEEIHDGQKMMFSWMREQQAAQQAANQANVAQNRHKGLSAAAQFKNHSDPRELMKPQDWSDVFEHLLASNNIELPDDYYHDELSFKDIDEFNRELKSKLGMPLNLFEGKT